MTETTVNISGMMCGMCEAHICDVIRARFAVRKVTASHSKGQAVILSESGLDEAILRCQMARELGAPMTMINCIRTLDEAKKIAEQDKGHKMWPDIRSLNGVPDILLDDIGPMGFSFVTCHFFEKAMMYGASDFAKHIVADRTSVYSDQHTMGGMTKEEQRRWIDLGLDPWLDAEAVFTDLSELREKHPGELDGDPLAY